MWTDPILSRKSGGRTGTSANSAIGLGIGPGLGTNQEEEKKAAVEKEETNALLQRLKQENQKLRQEVQRSAQLYDLLQRC